MVTRNIKIPVLSFSRAGCFDPALFCVNTNEILESIEVTERADQIDIVTGCLDEPETFKPTKDIFDTERLSWVPRISDHVIA